MSKVLFFDIETSPNVVYSWRVGYKIELSTDNIVDERKIICICWKFEGEDKTYALNWDKNQDDKEMLREFGEVLREADVAIGHNGDRFDLKWVKTRNLIHGLPPINNVTTIDTLKLVRNQFNFNSNRLDYLGEILGQGRKMETGGYRLWTEVMNGNKKSLRKMVDYCRQDVVLLEQVYQQLKPYVDKLPVHMGILNGAGRDSCPACGGKEVMKYGTVTARAGKYQKYKCKNCGHVYRDGRQIKI